ncbi:MAG: CheR family methyltransferase [Chloroflexota bacterium]
MMQARAGIESELLTELAEIVEAHSGLRFADSRRSELATKARRALADSGCATLGEYQALLASPAGGPLLDELTEALTVGETYFFRHRPYFDVLRHDVLPQLLAGRQRIRQFRVWCAGCATGEEAYSIAILLRETLPDVDEWDIAILGTDLNRRSLAQAEKATYSDWSFRETDDRFRGTYFTRDGARYRIRPELRRMVRFAYLNMAGDGYPSFLNGTTGLDLIFCRNVLIYFGPAMAERVLGLLGAALAVGGCLVLGPSDPTPGPLSNFEACTGRDAVVYRREPGPGHSVVAPGLPRDRGREPAETDAARLPAARDGAPMPPAWTARPASAGPAPRSSPAPRRRPALHGNPAHTGPASRQSPRTAARPEASGPATAPDSGWRVAYQSARVSTDRGRFEEAKMYCRQAIGQAQLQPEPHYLLATLCEAEGDDDGALTAFRKAAYLDRRFAPAYLGMAAIHRRAGQVDQARRELTRAHRLLDGRAPEELVLAEEGLTVGRLRDALTKGLARDSDGGLA